MGPLLALVLASGPGFLRPPELLVRAGEDSDDQALADACHLPGAQLELRTRSNMLATGTVDALRTCKNPRVLLRPPLVQAHRERLERVPQAQPVFELAQDAHLSWNEVSALGPRRIHVRVFGALTLERAAELARFRDVEVELDLRGRVPTADELARFHALDHASRSVRIGADAPPEEILALPTLQPSRVTVETHDNRLPPPLMGALEQADLPTCIALTWPLVPRDVESFAGIRKLSLELELGTIDELPRKVKAALAPVEPDDTKPAMSAAPGP
ncbi:MAG: hypothetical protein JST54_32955 [Deltaproteobacteria bacterium]|nr:hypothetical protein [Deltaproteobacteria bacterium]